MTINLTNLFIDPENNPLESITIRLVTKTDEDVVFEDSDIPCLVVLQFKKKSSKQ